MQTVRKLWQTPELREGVHTRLLRLPVLGRLIRLVASLRFAQSLGLQAKAGVPLHAAVALAAEATAFEPAIQAGARLVDRMKDGVPLSGALTEQKLFEPLLLEMVTVGEESGRLPFLLSRSAQMMEQEVQHLLEMTINALEPLIMGFLGLVVGFFVLGVALPLTQLLENL